MFNFILALSAFYFSSRSVGFLKSIFSSRMLFFQRKSLLRLQPIKRMKAINGFLEHLNIHCLMGENNYNSCFLLRIPATYLQSPAWKICPWWTLGRYILSIPERFWRLGRFTYEQHFHCKLHTLVLLLLVVLLLSLAEQPWANHSALGGHGALFSIHESLGSSWRISSFLYVPCIHRINMSTSLNTTVLMLAIEPRFMVKFVLTTVGLFWVVDFMIHSKRFHVSLK